MCRTVHALLSTAICGIQMLVRVFMTVILMIENLIRMILQTLYNFISFMLQMISLIPICVVFLVTARLKCFMCGGGGPCPVNRGGACDCLMSAAALLILFFIFRATGVLDKIFYKIGYVQAPPIAVVRFVPTPGDITECSRNVSDDTTTGATTETTTEPTEITSAGLRYFDYTTETETEEETETTTKMATLGKSKIFKTILFSKTQQTKVKSAQKTTPMKPETAASIMTVHGRQKTTTQAVHKTSQVEDTNEHMFPDQTQSNLTTVLYYLV